MKAILCILTFIVMIAVPAAAQRARRVQGVQKKKDTIFLQREFSGLPGQELYHVIYIDTARNSPYYKKLSDFSMDKHSRERFREELAQLKKNGRLTRHRITGIAKRWITLRYYKNKYYLYVPCDDHGIHEKISLTDTAFLHDYGEGMLPQRINSFRKQDAKTFALSLTGRENKTTMLVIHMVDAKKGIAVFEEVGKRFRLMADITRIRQFPIIVNHCGEKRDEFKLDEPDYLKLIGRK